MYERYQKPDLNHSIPFNSSLELTPKYSSVVNAIKDDIIRARKRQERPSSNSKVFIVVSAILANLIKATGDGTNEVSAIQSFKRPSTTLLKTTS